MLAMCAEGCKAFESNSSDTFLRPFACLASIHYLAGVEQLLDYCLKKACHQGACNSSHHVGAGISWGHTPVLELETLDAHLKQHCRGIRSRWKLISTSGSKQLNSLCHTIGKSADGEGSQLHPRSCTGRDVVAPRHIFQAFAESPISEHSQLTLTALVCTLYFAWLGIQMQRLNLDTCLT